MGKHINVLELKTVLVAVELWGPFLRGKHLIVRSDNSATVSAINKGSSKNMDMLAIVQSLFWLSVEFDFRLTSQHIPGRLNFLSDRISRLHDSSAALDAQAILSPFAESLECYGRMTHRTFLHLQECWQGVFKR